MIFVYKNGWAKIHRNNNPTHPNIFRLVAEMPNLKNLGALMNEDGTAGIQNNLRGCEVIETHEIGKTTVILAKKFCPSCPSGVQQPTDHVVIKRGLNDVNYTCDTCGYRYYYLKNELFTFFPEAQMKYIVKDYEKKVNKRPFELHYLEAKECGWWNNIDLDCTEIKENVWTAVTEISAQMFHRAMSGHAPGYLMCEQLSGLGQNPIPGEVGPKLQEGLAWLKQMEWM